MKNYKRNAMTVVFLFIIISRFFLFSTTAHCETPTQKKILILDSYSKGNGLDGISSSRWCDEIISSIESKFKEDNQYINLNVEYMDSTYYFSNNYYSMLYDLYKYKYSNTRFDAIISLDNNASDFLIKYANNLFPNTPVIFSGINQSKSTKVNRLPLFTGLYKNEDYKSTLDLALKFHPYAKHIFIILDKNSQGLSTRKTFNKLYPLYKDKVEFTFCDDENIDIVKEKIDNLPSNTVIFTNAQFNDKNGYYIPTPQVCKMLYTDCPFPVYSTAYSYLVSGIMGGMITNSTTLGNSLEKITLKILNGEKPSSISSTIDNSHNYMLNFDSLQNFNINMSSIPKDAQILNMPISTYSISRTLLIHCAVGFIIALIIIIIILLVIIYKLKNTKKLLSNSESLLKTIINSTPDIICYKDPNGKILQANNSILELLNVDNKNCNYSSLNYYENISSISDKDFSDFQDYDNKSWQHGDVYRTEEILTSRKDNTQKTYDIIRVPILNKDKTRRGLLLIGRDITEHKANEKNRKLINELKYYDKFKMDFFHKLIT